MFAFFTGKLLPLLSFPDLDCDWGLARGLMHEIALRILEHEGVVYRFPSLLPIEAFAITATFRNGASSSIAFDSACSSLEPDNFLRSPDMIGLTVGDITELSYIDGEGVLQHVPNPLYRG